MKKFLFAVFIAVFSASMGLSGCSSKASTDKASAEAANKDPARPTAPAHTVLARAEREYGVIEAINGTGSDVNAGTLIGGALGGLAGHQLGDGRGQTLTTIAGAVGGAVVGTKVANRNQVYKITVKLRDGEVVTFSQKASVADLKVGQRVKIVGDQVYPA